ncbi:trace amine-associated receptor 1-like [Pungitius pungitius]|uniref:trace amine-associated receptor 1-like n=1 Tax=Pungitius pungitius TaxID=134920 RepID=UPI002E0D55A4
MKLDMEINQTNALTKIHPCYKIDVSYVLAINPSAICALFHIFLGLLSAITVCGNLLVIIAIIYFKQLQDSTNFLILSLAVADLLVGVLVFPLTMEFSITFCLYDEDIFCKVRSTFDVLLCTCSILNLCCISVDRYYAVCQPLTYRAKINNHVVAIMILVSWGVSSVIAISFTVIAIYQEKCTAKCKIVALMANILGLIFSFYLPAFVMVFIYLKIFLVAQRQARRIQNTKRGVTVKMETKATKTLAIVMGLFLMAWLPFFLCTTVLSFSHVNVPLPLIELLNWFALSNSTLNPFIYALFYSWFKSAFRIIISGKIFQGNFKNTNLH